MPDPKARERIVPAIHRLSRTGRGRLADAPARVRPFPPPRRGAIPGMHVTAASDARLEGLMPASCLAGETLWIGGSFAKAASGELVDTFDPSTGKVLARLSRGAPADVDRAVKAAGAAASGWWASGGTARATVLRRTADLMRANAERLGRLDTLDSGRPVSVTAGSAGYAALLFDYYAGLTDKLHGATVPMGAEATALVEREPCGVVAAISPWNYPLENAATKIAPILACGNAMVLKPAEQTSLSALVLAELMKEAGLPDGVLNVVTGLGAEAGSPLVEHPGVAKASFTGSTATGRRIAALAGQHLKGVVLELGGKSPLVVFEDADVDGAARAAVFSTFMNVGQTCTSCNRVLVAAALRDRFVEACRAEAAKLRVGDASDPSTQVGPVVSAQQLARVEGLVGEIAGLDLDMPGYAPREGGYFRKPAIVTEFDFNGPFAREEVFGPVMAVRSFEDDEGAYALANDTEYGLAASVWTTSLARAERARRQLKVGIVWINCVHTLSPGTPVSGHKASGIGIEYGLEAVDQYMRVKTTVTMHGGWKSPFA